MTDLEQELRTRLRVAVDQTSAPDLMPDVSARVVRLRRRATAARAGGALTLAVILLAGVLAVGRAGRDLETAAPTDPDAAVQALPAAPIAARFQHAAVWTGTEVVVWGGCGDDGDARSDGAAYDPATRAWRKLAASPLEARCAPLAVWTGSEMVVVGGGGESPAAETTGAAYDPVADTWRPIARLTAGFANSSVATAVWTGTEVVVAGLATPDDQDGSTTLAFAYTPGTDTWRRIPDAPAALPLFGDAVGAAESGIYIVGTVGGSGKTQPVWQVLALYPNSATGGGWRTVPAPPIAVRGNPVVAWTGTELVVAGGQSAGSTWLTDGAVYDPRTNQWRALPAAPAGFAGASRSAEPVVGAKLVVLSTETGAPLVFDTAGGTWATGPSLGWPAERREREVGPVSEVPVVSTGDAVIAWGGGVSRRYEDGSAIGCCRPLDEGVHFTP